ncbi:MAG TPA: TaqI-like C-terminal specificity domain-containing protein, partial [Flavobacteriaceae bacterium]|nr:TaqI-like C-terminal specificity domain-containing protein [Flavobacteriaceae bacterium]
FVDKNLKKYQQTAPEYLYQAREKLIYKFISNQLCFYCDTEQRYVLNSANLLVLNPDFPISGKELTKLLNSDFMTWLFRKIFVTHKVLKSDLQHLPIHFEYFEKYGNFTEQNYLEYLGIKKSNGTYVLKR